MSFVGDAIGAVTGSTKATNKAAAATVSAAKKNDKTMRWIAQPYRDAATYAMPAMREYISGTLAPEINKDDPTLKAAHQENIAGIDTTVNQNLASSKRFADSTGNAGRFRGEEFRVKQQGQTAKNQENLSYTGAQRDVKTAARARYEAALENMASIGSSSTGVLASGANGVMQGQQNAANMQFQNSMGNASTFTGLLGLWAGKQWGLT